MPIEEDPGYAEGFWDAADLTPIYPDASPAYAAGWAAYWRCKALLETVQ